MDNKVTLEQKLEGWKNRMALTRTVARVIAVVVQLIITYYLVK